MIVGRKGGASKMGKLAALSLHSAQGQTLAITHTQEADSPSSVPGIASGLTDVGLGMALA